MPFVSRSVLPLLACVLVLSSCTDLRGERAAAPEQPPLPAVVGQPTAVGGADISDAIPVSAEDPVPEAFDFAGIELFSGMVLNGADLYEQHPMIIAFMTPWCAVCASEAPTVAELAEEHPDVSWIIVHSSGTSGEYREFATTYELEHPNITHIDDSGAAIWKRFGVITQPAFVIVDSAGVATGATGALGEQGLATAVEETQVEA